MTQAEIEKSSDGSGIDYEIDITRPSAQPNGDISYGAMTFFRNKSPNGLSPELHLEPDGSSSLRLAVARDAFVSAPGDDALKNDRCELRDKKLPLGTPVWYSFEIRASPDFPVADARCVCAQIKAPYYDADGGSPLFARRIDRGRYLATIEHLYEIKDTEIGGDIGRKVRNCGWTFEFNLPVQASPAQAEEAFAFSSRVRRYYGLDRRRQRLAGFRGAGGLLIPDRASERRSPGFIALCRLALVLRAALLSTPQAIAVGAGAAFVPRSANYARLDCRRRPPGYGQATAAGPRRKPLRRGIGLAGGRQGCGRAAPQNRGARLPEASRTMAGGWRRTQSAWLARRLTGIAIGRSGSVSVTIRRISCTWR
jgi:hypothetical protein